MTGLILTILLTSDPTAIIPQWKTGQEYLYRGTVKESGQGNDIQLLNQYKLELRVLVLSVKADATELICLTKLIHHGALPQDQTVSAHLVHAVVDGRGKITSCSAPTGLSINVEGPATWESGFILPAPLEAAPSRKPWESTEPGRLPRRFSWATSTDEGVTIIHGEQESIDWQRPRADSTAWRRLDKLTFTGAATVPRSVHRVIERRAPAHQHVTGRIITEYELVRQETLHGPMFQACQRDIQLLRQFQDEIRALSMQPLDRQSQAAWKKLESRLEKFQVSSGNTPYRDALPTLITTVEAGMGNRLSIQMASHNVPERSVPIGQFIPPFAITTGDGQTVTSQQLKGKPAMLIFMQPGSDLTKSLYLSLPSWQQSFGDNTFQCLLLTTSDKTGPLPPIPATSGKVVHTASGRSLAATYGIQATPTFVLIDGNGTLLSVKEGWGPDTKQELQKLLQKELGSGKK